MGCSASALCKKEDSDDTTSRPENLEAVADGILNNTKTFLYDHEHLVDDALDDAARRPAALVQRAHAAVLAASIYQDVAALGEEPS